MDYDGDENWDIHVVDVTTAEDKNLTPTPDHGVQIICWIGDSVSDSSPTVSIRLRPPLGAQRIKLGNLTRLPV